MSQHPDNVKRGELAFNALKAQGYGTDEFRDLLTDLRHYCDTHGICFAAEDQVAHRNYLAEVKDPVL